MTRENLVVTSDNIQVVDGKVVISSEELAEAYQSQEISLTAEESAEDFNFCIILRTGK